MRLQDIRIGIPRFYYEPSGNGYNLYFEKFSIVIGTEEIVMYNQLDEHEMTVHNQDLLRLAPESVSRGYHKVADLPNSTEGFFILTDGLNSAK